MFEVTVIYVYINKIQNFLVQVSSWHRSQEVLFLLPQNHHVWCRFISDGYQSGTLFFFALFSFVILFKTLWRHITNCQFPTSPTPTSQSFNGPSYTRIILRFCFQLILIDDKTYLVIGHCSALLFGHTITDVQPIVASTYFWTAFSRFEP